MKIHLYSFFHSVCVFLIVFGAFAAASYYGLMERLTEWRPFLFESLLISSLVALFCAVATYIDTYIFIRRNRERFFELKTVIRKVLCLWTKRFPPESVGTK